MEKNFFEKIKSKYILRFLFSYIWDENYIYKIFKYSKFFHNKLNLDYKYIPQNIIIFDKYLFDTNEIRLKNDFPIFELQPNKLKFDISNYFRNHPKKNIKGFNIFEFSIDIDILSPLFGILVKEDFFDNMFNIVIDLKKLEENNKICEKLEELDKMNLNTFSFKIFIKDGDINIFKKYFTNIHKIKKIEFYFYFYHDFKYAILDIMGNNLIYLKLAYEWKDNISFSFFLDNIQKFKSLNYLELCNCIFYYNKKNYKVFDNFFSKLKSLILINSDFEIPKDRDRHIELPKLEVLSLENSEINNYTNKIDFESLKHLKCFKGSVNDFSSLNCKLLKKVDIIDAKDWKYIFEKINNIQSLEELGIKNTYSPLKNNFEFLEYNETVKKIYLDLISEYECDLYKKNSQI